MPTLVDIAGLNPTLRQVFAASAALVAGLALAPLPDIAAKKTIGLTALGATGGAAEALVAGFRAIGEETTVFHANGCGGATFARFAEAGAFKAVVDMTVHEMNRWLFCGAYVDMPTRFSAAGELPRVVLPGGRACPIFCVSVTWSMLPERNKDDDDFEGPIGRTSEGLRAA